MSLALPHVDGLSGKRCVVTGGAGFIGSNFARHLYNKYPEYQILVVDGGQNQCVE